MTRDQLITWAVDHPWPTAGITAAALLVAVGAVWATIHTARSWTWPPMPVIVAATGALVCTAYTADTSWRFAEHHLGMRDTTERLVMFAAAEVALLACALMARSNKAATATHGQAGTPGVPGVLVWVITGVQVIPAYSESGIIGGTVRAIIGPVMAGLLWHLAMGLEIRVARPDALATGLPAMIGREVRERLLSYLGLATRDRSAEQITRDRATARAVRLASRNKLRTPWGRHRLAAAVARSGAALDPLQRDRLMQELAARRSAAELATIKVDSPWQPTALPTLTIERVPEVALPEVYPALPAPVPAPTNAVPAGAWLLPVICRRSIRPRAAVFAAAGSPTRTVIHAEVGLSEVALPDEVGLPEAEQVALPEDEEPEGDRDVPDPDPLIEQARIDFPTEAPGVGRLKKAYGIGQPRAQKIRDALTGSS
ncbi:hypothetical protein OG596_26420 [Streptomyces sp. NBC_01102]|uniref:hypothetical protein n=1 Tax=Streptomyces sp. NBC_01102 TaxID=2903749 RepID=UPI003868DA57|nr:hypothetical protein OG596_26420 [Streptomyces sp. NBC_01102]